jgi:hypothetical protein
MTAVTIAGQVAAMAETQAGQPPGGTRGVFAREQAELAAGGIPDGVIAPGALLPDADPFDPLGAPAMLHDATGNQRAVVVSYRGVVPLVHYGEDLPVRALARAHPPRSGPGGDQPPEAGRFADHAALDGAGR